MARIELDNIEKVFGEGGDEIVAVDGVDLTVTDGEFLVLVGPSGSGKSTLLRVVAGLEEQTDGDVRIDGEVVNGHRPRERDIAMVFQNYALYPNMTVRENMRFGLRMSTDLSTAEIDGKVERAAEIMEIDDLLDNTPDQLSGGEKQRAALGRAIVRDPQAFLMDEPLSNLDAKLRTIMRTEIKRLQSELDVTTIYVTHDQTEAMTMGDRLVILDGGEIQQVGTPLECFYRPSNLFVAGFIGSPSMNFFDADRQGRTLVGAGIEYTLPDAVLAAVGDVSALTIGARPEAVELFGTPQSDNDFECEIDVIEPMGSIKYVYLAPVGSDRDPFVVEVEGQRPISEDDTVFAHIAADSFHLFDAASGEALYHRELDDEAEAELTSEAARDLRA
jgi:multiple sugar transport system ATP-binding protein